MHAVASEDDVQIYTPMVRRIEVEQESDNFVMLMSCSVLQKIQPQQAVDVIMNALRVSYLMKQSVCASAGMPGACSLTYFVGGVCHLAWQAPLPAGDIWHRNLFIQHSHMSFNALQRQT